MLSHPVLEGLASPWPGQLTRRLCFCSWPLSQPLMLARLLPTTWPLLFPSFSSPFTYSAIMQLKCPFLRGTSLPGQGLVGDLHGTGDMSPSHLPTH